MFESGDFLVDAMSRVCHAISLMARYSVFGFCKLLNVNKRNTEFSAPKLYSEKIGQSLGDF